MSKNDTVISSGGGITPGPHHMHPAYVIMGAVQAVFIIIVSGFISMMSAFSRIMTSDFLKDNLIMVIALGSLVFLLLLAIALVISYLYYKRFTWELTKSDIYIRSGIIIKKQFHIPFQRVQSIDFDAGVIQRVLGIVRLKIDTAGGSTNRAAVIPALKLAEAEAMRAEVFSRKKQAALDAKQQDQDLSQIVAEQKTGADKFVNDVGAEIGGLRGVFADNFHEEAPVEYEYGLTAKELFLAAISGDRNFIILMTLIGFATQIPALAGILGLHETLEAAAAEVLKTQVVPLIITSIIAVFLITMILGIISAALSYGDFKARRRGGRIEVEKGLLSRQSRGVAITRVQSVEISQGFIRRLMGYGTLKLQTIDSMTAAEQQNGKGQMEVGLVVHPFVKIDRVDDILARLLREFDERPQSAEFKTLPKAAFRRVVNRHTILTALPYAVFALAATLILPNLPESVIPQTEFAQEIISWVIIALWVILLLIIIGRTIGAIMWYKNAAYSYNKTMLLIRQGFYGRVTTIIPRSKIQWAKTTQNPIQRMSRVASIVAVTAAGINGTKTKLRDLSDEEAIAYLDWVRPHHN